MTKFTAELWPQDDDGEYPVRWNYSTSERAMQHAAYFHTAEAAQEFADRLTAPYYGDTDPEVERLLREESEIERSAYRNHDPEAPPIPCVEVEATDGRRTWRAMGEDVRALSDEWERCLWYDDLWVKCSPENVRHRVYLVRRKAPRTERVQWWEAVGRIANKGNSTEPWTVSYVTSHGNGALCTCRNGFAFASDADGTVEVLVEGDR